MANSSFISRAKNIIIKEFIKDIDIVEAIDSRSVDPNHPQDLIGTHIFDYHQNPDTITTVQTFITVQVHIPQPYNIDKILINPTIEIWIVSHEDHMIVDNVPKITMNRNDYLSVLIDNKINGRSDFGIGDIMLLSNIEGAYQQNYLYRKLLFQCSDFNNSLCEEV